MKFQRSTTILAGWAMFVAASSHAATSTVYTDEASYLAAATVSATKDFNTDPIGKDYKGLEILSGVTAQTNAGILETFDSASIGTLLFAYDTGSTTTRSNGNLYYEFSMPTTLFNAVSFNVEAWNAVSTASTAKLYFADGTSTSYSFSKPAGSSEEDSFFLGFTADSAIRKIEWHEGWEMGTHVNEEVGFNNFSVAMAPVPEPETYAMMLAGLGLMGGWIRRNRKPA